MTPALNLLGQTLMLLLVLYGTGSAVQQGVLWVGYGYEAAALWFTWAVLTFNRDPRTRLRLELAVATMMPATWVLRLAALGTRAVVMTLIGLPPREAAALYLLVFVANAGDVALLYRLARERWRQRRTRINGG